MKTKLVFMLFSFCIMASVALAQADNVTGTVTNDETQARLRVNNCIFGGPTIDILLDGEIAVNDDIPQARVPALATWGYVYLLPGTYSVATVPTGMGLEQAVMGPVDVTVEAGHRYTVVVLGQVDEPSHKALVIDETAVYEGIGATSTDTAHITINNIRGAAGVTFTLDGTVREENVPYGEFRAALWPAGDFTGLDLTLHDAAGEVLVSDGFSDKYWNWPGTDTIDCVGGTVGTVGKDWFNETSSATSTLSALDFLEIGGSTEGSPATFDTFLSAVETAGLREALATGGPFLVYAPTDAAFAALPQDQRDALMADPEALADVARYHIGEGYYPFGNLRYPSLRIVPTLLSGRDLELRQDGTTNGLNITALVNLMVGNGTRMIPITRVLLPPKQ
jgi:hypothetical protein